MHTPKWESGLLIGLGETNLPPRKAVDLGSGIGTFTIPLATHAAYVEAYDSNPEWVEDLRQLLKEKNLSAVVRCRNVLHVDFAPCSLAAACVGMNIYIPKSSVRDLHQKLWRALLPGGLLHSMFATHEDEAEITEFVTEGCVPDPNDRGSYHHRCGSMYGPPCFYIRRGITGGSFWPPKEATEFLLGLGKAELVHEQTFAWQQDTGEKPLHRAFHTVTVIKKGY